MSTKQRTKPVIDSSGNWSDHRPNHGKAGVVPRGGNSTIHRRASIMATTTHADASGRTETLVGLRVSDEDRYARYRAGMTPILESMGGYFRYDMRVSELLRGQADEPFSRVFILSFPDAATRDRFFADPDYLRIREQYFTGAVSSFKILAAYQLV